MADGNVAVEAFDHHGAPRMRGLEKVPRSSTDLGRFGRLFRSLPPFHPSDQALAGLAASMAPASAADDPSGDNVTLPAGYTYFGQFVDHDITFDPVSVLERHNDPDALNTFRTPRFDLDSVYGGGRAVTPYLYDDEDPVKLLVGRNTQTIHEPEDLPRNHQGRALIGDPRNDVHVIVSQLHLAFLRFHNAIVDRLRDRFVPEAEVFDEARRLACWHYQWVVIHDFLPRLVGPNLYAEVLTGNPPTSRARVHLSFYSWRRKPWLPVEFSAAAYRFGHTMVRTGYKLNEFLEVLPVFPVARDPNPLQHLGGFRPLPKRWKIEWPRFFPVDGSSPQLARKIDTVIAKPLHQLPLSVDRDRRSLALLNLLRGRALQLPSGQAVAAAMGTALPDAPPADWGDAAVVLPAAGVRGRRRRAAPRADRGPDRRRSPAGTAQGGPFLVPPSRSHLGARPSRRDARPLHRRRPPAFRPGRIGPRKEGFATGRRAPARTAPGRCPPPGGSRRTGSRQPPWCASGE